MYQFDLSRCPALWPQTPPGEEQRKAMKKPFDLNEFIDNAVADAHRQNELVAKAGEVDRLRVEIQRLRHKVAELQEAGDLLWYSLRHYSREHIDERQDAMNEWMQARQSQVVLNPEEGKQP